MNRAAYTLRFGPFALDFPQRLLSRDGVPVRLGSRATGILVALTATPGQLLPRDALLAAVWAGTIVDEGALRVHLSAVRKALGCGADGIQYINNEPGHGYRFVAPVRRIGHGFSAAGDDAHGADGGAAPPHYTPAPLRLPAQVTRVLGRDGVVRQLLDQLMARRCLTISGPGGIGKTTVALALAHRFVAAGLGPACFIDFAPVAEAAHAVTVLASALGLQSGDSDSDPLRQLGAALGERPLLLLLDNCEHLVEALAPLAEQLLRAAPGVRLLITSREPLRAGGEWVHRLAPLGAPASCEQVDLAESGLYPAIDLFVERASEVRQDFTLDQHNLAAVCEICRRLDGIPLAIELAAARVDWLAPHAIAARLDERFKLLTKGRRTALPRQQTLRAALDWSHQLLAPNAQTLLRRLALFRGGFDMAAMQTVASDAMLSAEDVLDAAAELVAKSLLNCDPGGGGASEDGRAEAQFHLLDTTRCYALERLTASGDESAVRHRHALYCQHRPGIKIHSEALVGRAMPAMKPSAASWRRCGDPT